MKMLDKTVYIANTLTCKDRFDLIVCGGGVAGVAAALTARKRGLRVLLLEKTNILGGLATTGLVNYFVPMCNGRGKQVIFGMADEWFWASGKIGFNKTPAAWRNGEPETPPNSRMSRFYSPMIFALQLLEMIHNAGVNILFDCVLSQPVMDGKVCCGVVTESKSGREYYEAQFFIDTTGDCDLVRRSGMPYLLGKNYYTYYGYKITLDSCRRAVEKGDIAHIYAGEIHGGTANLHGNRQPPEKPLWSGTTVEDVTDYLVDNQLLLLENLKADAPFSRDLAQLPFMPQFRTTCCLQGDHVFREDVDRYVHYPDSVCVINNFERKDCLYEVRLGCLCRREFPNIAAAGRCASAEGYGWDVLRVIPPAILTGQAAAEAVVLAMEQGTAVADVDIGRLQKRLAEDDNMMIHFPDEWVPEDRCCGDIDNDIGAVHEE